MAAASIKHRLKEGGPCHISFNVTWTGVIKDKAAQTDCPMPHLGLGGSETSLLPTAAWTRLNGVRRFRASDGLYSRPSGPRSVIRTSLRMAAARVSDMRSLRYRRVLALPSRCPRVADSVDTETSLALSGVFNALPRAGSHRRR